ncbi:MAG: sigma-70 family RNA polymerase sigma factor [Nocardioides sp.]
MTLRAEQVEAELPGLLRYALALTRDPARAEDLVQDTVVRALERADQFRGDSAPATWLHRVMYHRFVDDARRRSAEPVDDEVLALAVEDAWRDDAYTVDADQVLLRAEVRDELYDALVRLPVPYRTAVVLHDVEGLTAAQLAEVQQVSLPAAKQRIRRGRAMLVTALAGGVERRAATRGVPMNCWEARSRIDEYLAGELGQAARAMLEQHLAGCPTCPALYASIVGVTEALGGLRDPDSVVPPALAGRVRSALDAAGHRSD